MKRQRDIPAAAQADWAQASLLWMFTNSLIESSESGGGFDARQQLRPTIERNYLQKWRFLIPNMRR